MKKYNKQEKNTTLIVILLVVIFLLLVAYGIKTRQVQRLDHYIACASICHPHLVNKDKSRIHCTCLESEDESTQ